MQNIIVDLITFAICGTSDDSNALSFKTKHLLAFRMKHFQVFVFFHLTWQLSFKYVFGSKVDIA